MSNTQFQRIPLSAIFESPDNPRKTYSDESLQNMAQTIIAVGVQSPIKVRPLPMMDGADHFTYEIIYGHRRVRGARIAAETTDIHDIDAIVEEMSDERADQIRLIENMQREDVSPVEEADAIVRLMDKHQINAEAIGDMLGVSRTTVFNKRKLASAHPKVREQCQAGVIGGEIATKVARMPLALQTAALKRIIVSTPDPAKGKDAVKATAVSLREADRILSGQFTVPIADARFNPEQELAGCKSCNGCENLSTNNEALVADFGAGTCIDKECFDHKTRAHLVWRVEQAKASGQRVIEGAQALELMPHKGSMNPTGFICTRHVQEYGRMPGDAGNRWIKFAELVTMAGDSAPQVTLMIHPHNPGELLELVTDDEADALLSLIPEEEADEDGAESGGTAPHKPAPEPLKPNEQAVTVHALWLRVKRAIMEKAAKASRTTDEMRLIISHLTEDIDNIPDDVAEIMGWPADELPVQFGAATAWLHERMQAMTADQLGLLIVLLVLDNAPFPLGHSAAELREARLKLADAYGVDVLDASADQEPAAAAINSAGASVDTTMPLNLQDQDATQTLTAAWPFPKPRVAHA